jgi:hypothetical protein
MGIEMVLLPSSGNSGAGERAEVVVGLEKWELEGQCQGWECYRGREVDCRHRGGTCGIRAVDAGGTLQIAIGRRWGPQDRWAHVPNP